uniref:RING-type domain-containing protein n=1 Tax=Eutreptiella gymnastica TaxID=73025 RepID=A0A7S1JDB3_9EUGL|mmetsp:Transcript_87655/g.152595  ORF Transcript_87655/g.152595 Transcript_87655/m.152595 type:complete len:102 (+) Transcript_87655:3-308(+)
MDMQVTEVLSCAHAFCDECLRKWFGSKSNCPTCRAQANSSFATLEDASWSLLEVPKMHEAYGEVEEYLQELLQQQRNEARICSLRCSFGNALFAIGDAISA